MASELLSSLLDDCLLVKGLYSCHGCVAFQLSLPFPNLDKLQHASHPSADRLIARVAVVVVDMG